MAGAQYLCSTPNGISGIQVFDGSVPKNPSNFSPRTLVVVVDSTSPPKLRPSMNGRHDAGTQV